MKDFDRWCELSEDKLAEEYEAKKSPIDWDEFVINKYEEFISEIENYEYEKFKDEK